MIVSGAPRLVEGLAAPMAARRPSYECAPIGGGECARRGEFAGATLLRTFSKISRIGFIPVLIVSPYLLAICVSPRELASADLSIIGLCIMFNFFDDLISIGRIPSCFLPIYGVFVMRPTDSSLRVKSVSIGNRIYFVVLAPTGGVLIFVSFLGRSLLFSYFLAMSSAIKSHVYTFTILPLLFLIIGGHWSALVGSLASGGVGLQPRRRCAFMA